MLSLHTFVNPTYSDNLGYKYGYQEFAQMSLMEVLQHNAPSLKAEVGYRVFCKFLTFVSSNWGFGLFIISLLMLRGYYSVIKLYSPSFFLSVLLIMVGPFLQSTFVLRQHLAMSIILFTYPTIINKRLLPYLLISITAVLFHQTALIFFPVYFLYHMPLKKFVIVAVTGFFVLYFFMSFFLSTVGHLAMETAAYGDNYFSQDMNSGSNFKAALLLGTLLVIRVLILKDNFYNEGITRLMSVVMVLGLIISVAGIGFIGTNRMNMYFTSTSFLFIPNTFYYLKNKKLSGIISFVYFMFMLFFIVKNSGDYSGIWFFSPNL